MRPDLETLPAERSALVREALAGVVGAREAAAGVLRPLGAGMDSLALLWEVDGRPPLVLRFPQRPDAARSVVMEAALLPELAPTLPLPIPRFAFTAPNPLGPSVFAAYEAVPGEVLTAAEWRRRGLTLEASVVSAVGELIDAIHRFPVPRAVELGVTVDDPRADSAADLARIEREIVPLLDDGAADELVSIWRRYLDDDANFEGDVSLTHADLGPDHLLVADGRVSGLIDFGDAIVGDPDSDLTSLASELGEAFLGRVQAARGQVLTARQLAKLRLWHRADAVGWVLSAIDHGDGDQLATWLGIVRDRLAQPWSQ